MTTVSKHARVILNCPLRKPPRGLVISFWIIVGASIAAIAIGLSYVVIHFVVKYW